MVYAVSAWVSPKHPLCKNSNRKGLQWFDTDATLVNTESTEGSAVVSLGSISCSEGPLTDYPLLTNQSR